MRVAIFSDIHGNAMALDAVLVEVAAAGGVDAYWVAGDVVDMGADPIACVERLRALPGLSIVRGNGDRAVIRSEAADLAARLPAMPAEDARQELMLLEEAAWTLGAITAAGHREWLEALPIEARPELPDGTRVVVSHASPGADDGPGSLATQSDDEMRALLRGRGDATLAVVGHTHTPLDRTVNGVRVLNAGSVSNPVTGDPRAMWALLEADASGYRVERRYAAYDWEAYLRQVAERRHPAESRIRAFFAIGR